MSEGVRSGGVRELGVEECKVKTKGEGEERKVRVWSWSWRKDIIAPSFRSCGTTRNQSANMRTDTVGTDPASPKRELRGLSGLGVRPNPSVKDFPHKILIF